MTKFSALRDENRLTPDLIFRDSYFLARQKRMTGDSEDYYAAAGLKTKGG